MLHNLLIILLNAMLNKLIKCFVKHNSKQFVKFFVKHDESQKAYCAVGYVHGAAFTAQVQVTLLTAKTKMAPLKTVNIPRLELCAANLLSKLVATVSSSVNITEMHA